MSGVQALLQRAPTSCIVPLRALGRGAFAAIDLVSMPVGGAHKVLVCKRLAHPDGTDVTRGINQQQQEQQHQAVVPPTLKSSSVQDWSREASMHRQCAGCPFVLQLLAAKRCRTGSLLLLTEYAAAGSLTDVLARLQHKQRAQTMKDPLAQPLPSAPGASVLVSVPADMCAASGTILDTSTGKLPHADSATAVLVDGVDVAVDPTVSGKVVAAAAAALPGCNAPAAVATCDTEAVTAGPRGLPEEAARFFTACILQGLQWLHSRRIVHRWAWVGSERLRLWVTAWRRLRHQALAATLASNGLSGVCTYGRRSTLG